MSAAHARPAPDPALAARAQRLTPGNDGEPDAAAEQLRNFLYDYGHCLDDDRLEDWPAFFAENGSYRIIPRENLDRGMTFALMFLENRNQLRDRVLVIRKALVYAPRMYCHLIGSIRCRQGADSGRFDLRASCAVYATDIVEGTSKLFAAGRYDGQVAANADGLQFTRLDLILDTSSVDRQMPIPL